jgi:hypothetical protein
VDTLFYSLGTVKPLKSRLGTSGGRSVTMAEPEKASGDARDVLDVLESEVKEFDKVWSLEAPCFIRG